MRKETIDEMWAAGSEGDPFALAAMGIICYEGKHVRRDVEHGIAYLEHAAQSNLLWARDNLYFIKRRLNGNPNLKRNVLISRDAIQQMNTYAQQGNLYALAMIGEYFICQNQDEGLQAKGLEYLNIAVLRGSLWAEDILRDLGITSGVTAKEDPLGDSSMGPRMRSFVERSLKERFGSDMSIWEIQQGIKSACDFFGISYPKMVQDLSDMKCGSTMFCNVDRQSFSDDILCYDLEQLKRLNVRTPDAFTLVMTHECAHRVFQDCNFDGPNNGQWDEEMVADYFMGVRSGMQGIDIRDVIRGFQNSSGSMSHPSGALRVKVMWFGKTHVEELLRRGYRPTLQGLFNDYMEFRSSIDDEVRRAFLNVGFSIVHRNR